MVGLRRLERVDSVQETPRGLRAALDGETLRLDVVRDDVVRVKISRAGVFDDSPTHAVCADTSSVDVDFAVERGDGVVRLRTAAMTISVGLDPFRLDAHRADGTAIAETAAGEDGRPCAYATLNDAWVLRRSCRPEDAIYGLGEKSGRHDRRGRDFTLWNTDVLDPYGTKQFTDGRPPGDPRGDRRSVEFDPYYVSIPFLYHHAHATGAMAGSFVDNGHRATYDLTGDESYEIRFSGGQYTEYLFAGPAMADVLEAYTWLTGRPALPPLWALGYHQCRWFRYTQDAVEALADRHRELGIPCDALWLDIEHMDGYRVFTWDGEAFPDVPAMLSRLGDQGVKVVTIVDPGVKREPGYRVFDEGVERDALCRTEGGDLYVGQVWPGETVFPDFATEEARAWWGRLNGAHVRSGIAGIWNDMNEPATGEIPPERMRFDHGRASHERYHNQYGLLMAMATAEGLREAQPDRRPFILSRAGFAGIQRYAANWMGDNQSRWDHLWLSMPMAMGFGVSGQPFVGADVGGFQGQSQAELFLRWMQYGALTPFFRNHSEIGYVDQYAWSWGEAVLELVREAVRLRYRLLPYVYAAFVRATETGEPVQRPLVFDHQDDPAVRDLDDEYLFGRDLLVAPVTEAGQTARQVYLPAGDWYDWHTGEAFSGGRWLLVATPMDRIPLYARAGAVIPMWPDAPSSTAGYRPEAVELHLFLPRADGAWESLLVEDDGESLDGPRRRTTFAVQRRGGRVTLDAAVEGDGDFGRRSFALVLHGPVPEAVEVGGERVAVSDGRATVADRGEPFRVAFDA